MNILGISAFYHDSAAALICDGEIRAAAQEERFSRRKFDPLFPHQSIRFCLQSTGLSFSDLDEIVYYEKPFLSFERLLFTMVERFPRTWPAFLVSMPVWMREKLNTRALLQRHLYEHFGFHPRLKISFSQHHLSHAASAFFPSPFESAAVLCLDGVGEWVSTTGWLGSANTLKPLWEIKFPHSIGLLYSSFTVFCGFKVHSGEYKLMGLAPYGKPRFEKLILENLVDVKADGSFRLNMEYFSYLDSLSMTNSKFARLFGCGPRAPETEMAQIYKDLAASIQVVVEQIILKLAKNLRNQTQCPHLCLSGGVALNCVANGLIAREKIFDKIWIQPAAGDAGSALGAALASFYIQHGGRREILPGDAMRGSLLGPSYSDDEIQKILEDAGARYERLSQDALLEAATNALKAQKVIGWFQGRMEFGPRALGARSILGDARDPRMKSRMNLKIKFRESFRPFAPAVLAEDFSTVFEGDTQNPYMLLVQQVRSECKDLYPAITHVDGTARVQSVDIEKSPLFHALLKKFKSVTGAPLLINTSFNVRGEPMVESPEDALRCFINTDMDSLFIGSFYLEKENQAFSRNHERWRRIHALD